MLLGNIPDSSPAAADRRENETKKERKKLEEEQSSSVVDLLTSKCPRLHQRRSSITAHTLLAQTMMQHSKSKTLWEQYNEQNSFARVANSQINLPLCTRLKSQTFIKSHCNK